MKFKFLVLPFILLIFSANCFAQKNVRDSLKEFTIGIVRQAIEKGKVKKLAVWDFTNMNKEVFNFGSYIAEQFSVYAELVDSIELMDRQNLKSVLNEHKLKSEGFIDKNTIMELGKFRDVDAVVVGSVIMADKDFQVVVKVIETSFGKTVAADEQFFFIDKRMAAILGIEFTESTGSGSLNRGYNRPLNSNEQYNNSSTVNQACEKNNTGDYCFYNGSKKTLRVYATITPPYKPGTIQGYSSPDDYILLKPGESKCIYNIDIESNVTFKVTDDVSYPGNYSGEKKYYDKGDIIIEKCKSKTYNIK